MIILGIDPGSRITGFGVININNNKCSYVASGCILVHEKRKNIEVSSKLKQIQDGINEVIKLYKPTEASIEQVFMFNNPNSALKLGQARGVAICSLENHGLTIAEYSAKQVKKSIVGNGNASKIQVQHMIQSFLNLNNIPKPDAADALAIAICHFHTKRGLQSFSSESKKMVRGRLR